MEAEIQHYAGTVHYWLTDVSTENQNISLTSSSSCRSDKLPTLTVSQHLHLAGVKVHRAKSEMGHCLNVCYHHERQMPVGEMYWLIVARGTPDVQGTQYIICVPIAGWLVSCTSYFICMYFFFIYM